VAAVEHQDARARVLGLFDGEAKRTGEVAMPAGALLAMPFGSGWLVQTTGATHLTPVDPAKPVRGKAAMFADGGSDVTAFAVAVDGIAVARTGSLELWTHAGKQRWVVESGPWLQTAIVRGHVLALGEDGALVFTQMRDGATVGTVHLASTEAATEWRLAVIDAGRLVLGLGDWLVWIDVVTKKTLRRVRAKDRVTSLAADGEWVAAGLADGSVQIFRAEDGEPGASFDAHEGGVAVLALGKKALFTAGVSGPVRAFPRTSLGAARRVASPVTALAARGDLVATGDQLGNVRILKAGAEVGIRPLGEPVTSVFLGKTGALVAASGRMVTSAAPPWDAPRPLALRTKATSFAADDDYAFAGTEAGSVDVYDLGEGTHVTTYALAEGEVTALARLPGRLLVVGAGALDDGKIFVVDVTEAKVVHRLEPHDEAFGVTCLAADARGRLVASGADDGSIALLDPVRGKVLARLRVRETPVSLAFEASGRRLACVFADATAGVVELGNRGATIDDLALRGVSRVAWGDDVAFGFADGRIERVQPGRKGEPARAGI